jgi:hypothetical protein
MINATINDVHRGCSFSRAGGPMKSHSLMIASAGLLLLTVAALAEKQQAPLQGDGIADKTKAVPQPAAEGKPAGAPATRPAFAGNGKDEWESYQAMHALFLDHFIRSEGFGLRRVIRIQDEPRLKRLYADGVRYMVGRVELISLNDGKEPFVYQAPEYGPMKNALKDARREPLAEGEADALTQIKDGKDVVLMGPADKRELVGAVRATADCMKCHSVKEGTLLGAFRYPLRREVIPVEPVQTQTRQQSVQRAK